MGKGMVKFTWLFRIVVTGTLSCYLYYFVLHNDISYDVEACSTKYVDMDMRNWLVQLEN